ncbi:hypothetical protein [Propylenella binzhouense]|uniref:Uncharacterized protein n=1 Tax=Propylenella binzhouense TaxID=2555902 RepID=A0A964T8H3_9HYPH|nr:hypothetical protein [Propylenella binzhouense]MYZ50005.1 hypothetical protein [Propylenella binzhouense]
MNADRSAQVLLDAIARAETAVIAAVEHECAALRGGRSDEAPRLQARIADASRSYLAVIRTARSRLDRLEFARPGIRDELERRRTAFAALLKIELAVLAAVRAAASDALPPPIGAAA